MTIRETACAECKAPVEIEEVVTYGSPLSGPHASIETRERCTNPQCKTNRPAGDPRLAPPTP